MKKDTASDNTTSLKPIERPYKHFDVIDVVEQLNFNRGNAVKYILCAGFNGTELEDMEKAIWYLQREIDRTTEPSTEKD